MPTRGRAVRPREAATAAHVRLRRAPATAHRARSPRLSTRGRAVRPREAATARRAGLPREPASCGSPACLLRLQIPSAGTLAVAVQPRAS